MYYTQTPSLANAGLFGLQSIEINESTFAVAPSLSPDRINLIFY